eukprot:CAMPEP_0113635556 /NCGR_PEP_ID=MMETSP0017_2-20120614/18537_1 /TAXON_ID=2856 /ORGANISM="Cylindrotheca closterium" /LENGTH=95 /DNA_ID=CAMNT_0000546347 /DNA_START=287 /DNA_END=571 /DNA_ORIENTATION=+ /assembly_acc=CAM_ASM_000147
MDENTKYTWRYFASRWINLADMVDGPRTGPGPLPTPKNVVKPHQKGPMNLCSIMPTIYQDSCRSATDRNLNLTTNTTTRAILMNEHSSQQSEANL